MTAPLQNVEVLDLRHFSGPQLAPLLRDEARRWEERLHWQYDAATKLLLEYLDGRILPGFIALDPETKRLLGYSFCVYEASKAVIGDVYAFGETAGAPSPICLTLLTHLLETLIASPGIDRIESQMLMFPPGALHGPVARYGFRSFPRLFEMASLDAPAMLIPAEPLGKNSALRLERWQPEFLRPAADLICRCYLGHEDAQINDQYRTVAGSERFLHNIIRFPGCGLFDPENSLVLLDRHTGTLQALLLCSRVHADTAHITQLCVTPTLRGLGLGRTLLLTCAENLRRRGLHHVSLTVTEANTQARKLYEGLGFTIRERFEALTWNAR